MDVYGLRELTQKELNDRASVEEIRTLWKPENLQEWKDILIDIKVELLRLFNEHAIAYKAEEQTFLNSMRIYPLHEWEAYKQDYANTKHKYDTMISAVEARIIKIDNEFERLEAGQDDVAVYLQDLPFAVNEVAMAYSAIPEEDEEEEEIPTPAPSSKRQQLHFERMEKFKENWRYGYKNGLLKGMEYMLYLMAETAMDDEAMRDSIINFVKQEITPWIEHAELTGVNSAPKFKEWFEKNG